MSNPNTIMRDETIPEDVWRAADEALDNMLCNCVESSGSHEQFRADSVSAIARAILAERAAENERCAKLVEEHELQFVLETIPERASDRQQQVFVPGAQRAIASSIRSSHE